MRAAGFELALHAAGCLCSWEVWGLVGVEAGYFYDAWLLAPVRIV